MPHADRTNTPDGQRDQTGPTNTTLLYHNSHISHQHEVQTETEYKPFAETKRRTKIDRTHRHTHTNHTNKFFSECRPPRLRSPSTLPKGEREERERERMHACIHPSHSARRPASQPHAFCPVCSLHATPHARILDIRRTF